MNYKTTEQKILKFIDREKLIQPGDRILLALSGGPDSVFALYFLLKFKRRLKIDFSCAHINHQLRGEESDKDEDFSRKLCAKNSVDFYSEKVDVRQRRKSRGESIEEAARELRYMVFEKLASSENFNKILTAHNQSDNTETVLLNLSKGTGIKGLRGIPAKRGKIIRPFLCVSKPEIYEYLLGRKIKFRKDKSNADEKFQRNYLRRQIIPKLEKNINPAFDDAVFNTSQNISVFENVYLELFGSLRDKYFREKGDGLEFILRMKNDYSRDTFLELMRQTVSQEWEVGLSRKDIEKIDALSDSIVGSFVQLKKKVTVYRERGRIVFKRKKVETGFKPVKLKIGESFKNEGTFIRLERLNKTGELEFDNGFELISGDRIRGEFTLRRWKNGDRFRPLGMRNSKKISDFLTEVKIPASSKKEQLVLENDGKIVYVIGLRISDEFKIKSNTKKVIRIWTKK